MRDGRLSFLTDSTADLISFRVARNSARARSDASQIGPRESGIETRISEKSSLASIPPPSAAFSPLFWVCDSVQYMPDIDTFQPEKRVLGQLLSSTSPPIRVPDFQRDYSWENAQVAEFWDDLIAFGGSGPSTAKIAGKEYFLGAAVLVNNGSYHLLLDGQQRLATATILLAALRDRIYPFNENAARQIQDQYIAFQDHLTGERLVKIQLNIFDRDFFRDYIQSLPRVANTTPSKKSHQLIKKAYEYFSGQIETGWQEAGDGKKGFDWAAYVTLVLREHMALVTVVSNNEKSAASIFTTLNDRGIGLSSVDLIRSFVLQNAPEGQREEIIQCWEAALEACGTAIAGETLIRMSWVAEHGDINSRAI